MNRKKIIRRLSVTFAILLMVCFVVAILAIEDAWQEKSLWSAASSGNALAAWHLISNGADVNARDKDGYTPLIYAAAYGHPWVVRQLLKAGADPTFVDHDGDTPLACAIRSGEYGSTEVMELLIQAGGLANKGPIYLFYRLSDAHTATAHILTLLKHGVDPNARYPDGMTLLMGFALDGGASEVAALAEHGADVNAMAKDGQTALSEAVRWGYIDTVRCLLDHGANVNTKFNGQSMIELATNGESGIKSDFQDSDAVIDLLRSRGAPEK